MTLAEFVQDVVKRNLSYKEKLVLIYLASVGDWMTRKELAGAVDMNHDPGANNGRLFPQLMSSWLVERRGSRHRYEYRVRL